MNKDTEHKHFYKEDDEKLLEYFIKESYPQMTNMNLDAIKRKTYLKKRAAEQHRKRFIRISSGILVAACIAAAVALSLPLVNSVMDRNGVTPSKELLSENVTVKVPVGRTTIINMSDGTKVTANSNTTISYPCIFSGDKREVTVHGEAYFEVAHDKQHPFIVHTNGVSVTVLGTKFNVCDYGGKQTDVVLLEGSVELLTAANDRVRMKPNRKATVSGGAITQVTDVNATDYIEWMDGLLMLNGETLDRVVLRLNNYYGTNIVINRHSKRSLYGKLALQPDVNAVIQSINAISGTTTLSNHTKKQ